jgi:phosphatidylglycerophosphatase A
MAAPSRNPIESLRIGIATLGGVGYAPWASGTFGTAASVPVYLLLAWPQSPWFYFAGSVAAIAVAVWGCHAAERRFGRKDPGEAVADELAGFLVTMAFLPLSAGMVAAGFFAFRATDVIKPFPARRLERLPGGWGIVADDLMAGVWANLLLRAGLIAAHFWRGTA